MTFEFQTATVLELVRDGLLWVEDGNHGENRPLAHEFNETGTPFIRPDDLSGGSVRFEECDRINEVALQRVRKGKGRAGDIAFTHRATVGRIARVSDDAPSFVANPGVTIWRSLNSELLDRNYLYYFMQTPFFMDQVWAEAGNTDTFPYISLTQQRRLLVRFPEIAQQRVTGALLGDLDDRITLLRETNATLEAIAQTLFKSWFVNFDPVHAKSEGRDPEGIDEATAALFPDSFEESALAFVPKGWSRTSLAALTAQHGGTIQTGPFGSQLHASDYSSEGTPVAMPKDIADRRINTSTVARVSSEHVVRLSRHQLRAGDIVFSRRGDVERHALVMSREAGWLCGTGCLLVRSGAKWRWPAYLSLLLDAPLAKAWLVQHAVGATMPNLNTGILGSVPLTLPPSNILDRFESVAMGLEERRSENLATMKTLAALRDTLLPRLISGQLRLSGIDTTQEAIAA